MNFEQVPNTPSDAIEMANEISRLEAASKLIKDNLKKYVKEHGPVETSIEKWGFYPSISWSFNKDMTQEIARNLVLEGVDPWSLITFQAKDLKALGWEDSSLEQFGNKKVTERFSSRKL
ncbi:hypothetical protein [Rummeliibacillus pycnus]|uniref:hypothetical protein n=1 Tax=Rummeliibacillus pycnus TaxID=101070 RepID=UPI003D2CE7F4